MLNSRASHNIMHKVIMEKIGLGITKQFHVWCSFYFNKLKSLGIIKVLVVTLLAQSSTKSIVMDVVAANVPTRYGMLLSRTSIQSMGDTM